MLRISKLPLSISARRVRWGLLGFTAATMLGACCYSWGYKLPRLGCPILQLTGIPCPACGMTRSFIAMVEGNLSQASAHHLFGPLLFAGFVIAAVHTTLELFIGKQIKAPYISAVNNSRFLLTSLVAVLTYHAYRLLHLAGSGELYASFVQSPLAALVLRIAHY